MHKSHWHVVDCTTELDDAADMCENDDCVAKIKVCFLSKTLMTNSLFVSQLKTIVGTPRFCEDKKVTHTFEAIGKSAGCEVQISGIGDNGSLEVVEANDSPTEP